MPQMREAGSSRQKRPGKNAAIKYLDKQEPKALLLPFGRAREAGHVEPMLNCQARPGLQHNPSSPELRPLHVTQLYFVVLA